MSNLKLFGNTRSAKHAAKHTAVKPQKPGKKKKILTVLMVLVLLLEGVYYTAIYSDNAFIAKWRDIYIQTAMETLSHQWLATALIPQSVIDVSVSAMQEAMETQIGITSDWSLDEETDLALSTEPDPDDTATAEPDDAQVSEEDSTVEEDPEPSVDPEQLAREAFFEEFWEIDQDSFDTYAAAHPEILADGWEGIYINEAGLDDSGTDIYTIYGDQILAIDVPNQILLIRITGSTYRGVMAIAKDETQLRIGASTGIGSYGQYAGDIATQENAVLAVNASGFIDPDGVGNGGILAGYTVYQGTRLGTHMGWGYKRLELREDNLMYIVDAQSAVADDVTDAVEFLPAMIVDGEIVVDSSNYNSMQPRSCIGQTANYDIMMLIVEGRMTSSLGVTLLDCAEVMQQYGCVQAMNQDGGSSAIMWYRGEYITRCSNGYTPGRQLPNAWVYGYAN